MGYDYASRIFFYELDKDPRNRGGIFFVAFIAFFPTQRLKNYDSFLTPQVDFGRVQCTLTLPWELVREVVLKRGLTREINCLLR